MVERPLRMRDAPGSIPGSSTVSFWLGRTNKSDKIWTTQTGLEPATFWSEVRCAIHCATRPYILSTRFNTDILWEFEPFCFVFKKISPSGNWTRVSRVTGGDTHHYTNEDTSNCSTQHVIVTIETKYYIWSMSKLMVLCVRMAEWSKAPDSRIPCFWNSK